MSHFNLVYSEFWPEARARAWNDDMDKIGLYLLTCEHRTIAGLFRMPLPYVSADLGWPIERVANALGEVIQEGFAGYDNNAQVVLIRNSVKRQPPKSAKHVAGAITSLKRLPKTPLLRDLLVVAETHAEGFAIAIRKAFEWVNDSATPPESKEWGTHSKHARARTDLRQQTTDIRPTEDGSTATQPTSAASGGFVELHDVLRETAA